VKFVGVNYKTQHQLFEPQANNRASHANKMALMYQDISLPEKGCLRKTLAEGSLITVLADLRLDKENKQYNSPKDAYSWLAVVDNSTINE